MDRDFCHIFSNRIQRGFSFHNAMYSWPCEHRRKFHISAGVTLLEHMAVCQQMSSWKPEVDAAGRAGNDITISKTPVIYQLLLANQLLSIWSVYLFIISIMQACIFLLQKLVFQPLPCLFIWEYNRIIWIVITFLNKSCNWNWISHCSSTLKGT